MTSIGPLVHALGDRFIEWDTATEKRAAEAVAARRSQLEARLLVSDALAEPEKSLPRAVARLLDPHQMEAAAAIAVGKLRGLALFDEQGTGKTLSALAGFLALKEAGVLARAIVIVPKSVVGAWRSDARKLDPHLTVIAAVGATIHRRQRMMRPHDVLIVTYEGVVADEKLLETLLRATPRRYMMVVDESYFAKNPRTRRAQALARLRPHCERAVVLCGTPAPNRPWDIVNQVTLADGGIAFGSAQEPADRDAALAFVEQGLASAIYLRRLKATVLPDLPAQAFNVIPVRMAPQQAALYERAVETLVLDVRSVTDEVFRRNLAGFLARRSALLQICSHPGGLDPLYDEQPAKLTALRRLLAEFIERRDEKVVIWSWFRFSLATIATTFRDYGVARIDGTIAGIDDRIDAIDRFQNSSSTRLFIGNAGAAGAGITLTSARLVIYESFSNQAAHFMQSLDRVHRRGQERAVEYHVLLCDRTIEQWEYERLLRKQRDARALLRDEYEEPPTRLAFLADLERGVWGGDHHSDASSSRGGSKSGPH